MTQVGFIYKLCCIDPEIKEIYVGSTKNLRVRKNQHKTRCNNQNDAKFNVHVYQFIRGNGGFSNFDIIQLERVEFNTKYELRARERHYIELLTASLNKQIPTVSENKYYEENKEKIKEYREKNKEKIREYREKNREKANKNSKKYREKNKEKVNEYNKQYREQNKEKAREYNKKYREQNKEKAKEYDKKYREQKKQKSEK